MASPQLKQIPLPTAPPEKVGEQIRVAVDFAGPKITPLAFLWRGQKYTITKVNLVYKRVHGNRPKWCFAVSDAANSFVLMYDPQELRWTLEEIYSL